MPRVPCIGAAYRDRSLIASAQETINLYPEKNQNPTAPVPVTHYLTPGTTLFATPNVEDNSRGSFQTSIGTAYTVVGTNVYFINTNGAMVLVGTIADRQSQIIMADNGLVLVLVDGVQGWAIDMATNAFGEIIGAAFYGADFVTFLDTFFIFNRPDTNQFYITLAMVTFAQLTGGTAFDPLDIAAKSGSADNIVAVIAVHKELWLIGELTTEIWIGTGAADFYFQLVQGAFIQHGCLAPYSVASTDVVVIWIMQDKAGQFQIMKGAGYEVQNIATSYLTDQMQSYGVVNDAVAGIFQQQNHAFYVVSFPSANVTWVYDLGTDEWFRWAWLDNNGNLNRHRAQNFIFFNNENMIGDWETGKIYILDPNVLTDFGGPIMRRKTFLHMVGSEFERVNYLSFDADIEAGTSDVNDPNLVEKLYLSWSDDRGKTYGQAIGQSFGDQGKFLTTLSWNRLGQARDRIFKLEWSAPYKTSLNGGFALARPARS